MTLKLVRLQVLILILTIWGMRMTHAQTSAVTAISLNGDTITVDGSGATTSGSTATITSEGTYTLSGTLTNGQILVDSDSDGLVTLILNGVHITNATSAPIYIKEAGSARITLTDGTQNTLTDSSVYVYESPDDNEPNAALFSDDLLTIDGSGSLSVTANYNDGIASKDGLIINGNPTLTINAVDDGLRGKDYLVIGGGTINITAGGDGLKSDNENDDALAYITIDGGDIVIDAGDDGLQAERDFTLNDGSLTLTAIGDGIHAEYNLTVNGGLINIQNSYEGIEGGFIVINDGDIHLVSSDDGFNVSEPDDVATPTTQQGGQGRGGGFGASNSPYYLHITGGSIVVNAQGDGLDSNGSIEMTGGTVIVNGPTMSGNGALDYNGTFNMTGGFLVAAGSAGMPQAPSETSTLYSVMLNFTATMPAGTLIHIRNSTGQNVLTFAPVKDYQSVVLASSALVIGESYEVYIGGTSDSAQTDHVYRESPSTLGNLYTSFTISDILTQIGTVRGMRR